MFHRFSLEELSGTVIAVKIFVGLNNSVNNLRNKDKIYYYDNMRAVMFYLSQTK